MKRCSGVIAVLILALPLWAGTKSSHKVSADYDVTQPTMVGRTNLQPGHYTIEATEGENQFDVLQNGRVLATVPCHWVKLPKKAQDTEITADRSQVNEIEFQGRAEAVKVG